MQVHMTVPAAVMAHSGREAQGSGGLGDRRSGMKRHAQRVVHLHALAHHGRRRGGIRWRRGRAQVAPAARVPEHKCLLQRQQRRRLACSRPRTCGIAQQRRQLGLVCERAADLVPGGDERRASPALKARRKAVPSQRAVC